QVVLPAPFGPSRPTTSPSRIEKPKSRTTWRALKLFCRPSAESMELVMFLRGRAAAGGCGHGRCTGCRGWRAGGSRRRRLRLRLGQEYAVHESVAAGFAGNLAGVRVVGQLVAMKFAAALLLDGGAAGEHGNAVDVVVVELGGVARHQVVVLVQLLDVRGLAGDHDMRDLGVRIEMDLGEVAG